MSLPDAWLPTTVNQGPWLVHYTFHELVERIERDRVVLPICSLGTNPDELARLAPLVLPPLYHEALEDHGLKQSLLAQIERTFPYYEPTQARCCTQCRLEVVELPAREMASPLAADVLAFSVDTAVEEHGPHLPLATDRIQSYLVLSRLLSEFAGLQIAPPVDYGHLTWGLPLGLSIDITPALLTRYVAGFAAALEHWARPRSLYVVDVHGSPVHRQAIQDGLAASGVQRWAFRWLYEPLVEFASERGDQHAGGVETAMVEQASQALLDPRWWPNRLEELAANEMSFELALELTPNLDQFIAYAESQPWNGIVGRVQNYHDVSGSELLERAIQLARMDIQGLLS